QRLGELVTGAVLVRETMAPDYRLQALLRSDDNRMRIVADSHPDGGSRGLITRGGEPHSPNAPFSLAGSTLEIVRTLYNGDLHRGVIEVPANGGMSAALM